MSARPDILASGLAKRYGDVSAVTILYLPQLLGMAFGLSDEILGLGLNLALDDHFGSKRKAAISFHAEENEQTA